MQQNSVSTGKAQKTHSCISGTWNYSHYGNQWSDYLVSFLGNTGTFKEKGLDCRVCCGLPQLTL